MSATNFFVVEHNGKSERVSLQQPKDESILNMTMLLWSLPDAAFDNGDYAHVVFQGVRHRFKLGRLKGQRSNKFLGTCN